MTVLRSSTRTFDSGPNPSHLAELKEYYKHSEGYRAHLEAKGPAYFEEFVEVVVSSSSPSDRILDVGCGTGESTVQLCSWSKSLARTFPDCLCAPQGPRRAHRS